MLIQPATFGNAQEILDLQKLAYISEAEIYGDSSIPPLTQTLDEIRFDFNRRLFLKATDTEKIVGSVRGHMDRDTCCIGRLVVHPDFQKRGLGARLMKAIEERFSQARRYELFTGHLSERNLRLYGRLGYTPCATKKITANLTLVFLEKTRESSDG